MQNLDEVVTEVSALPQSSSSQSGSACGADQTDGGLIDQMHEVLGKKREKDGSHCKIKYCTNGT